VSFDWNVYSDEIDEEIEESKEDFNINVFEIYKDYLSHAIYYFLENMIPLIDFDRPYFTLRLSYECALNKEDERNIFFSLPEEIATYDGGDFERLDKLKQIFINSANIVEAKIKELEKTWER